MKRADYVFFLNKRFLQAATGVLFLLVTGNFVPFVDVVAQLAFVVFCALSVLDFVLLLSGRKTPVTGSRRMADRFSNGDDNQVKITIRNNINYAIRGTIIDELPVQFQKHDFAIETQLTPGEEQSLNYGLRPVERGEYHFGRVLVFYSSPIGFFQRRVTIAPPAMVKVYPAFKEMRKYEMMAISNRLSEAGIKRIRQVGHQMEFDQIRDYIKGDDYRTINWKATARKSHLMVNQYQEERSQQMISVIDMGRTMQMPFNGMTLLDYAINTALVMSNIAIVKHDKAGLVTFNDEIQTVIPPRKESHHIQTIMEALFNQQTTFAECDYHPLYATIKRKISQRSLLMLYCNFETIHALKRQLPVLQTLARQHLVVVIFFENSELADFTLSEANDLEEIYTKTIAQKFIYDKQLITRFLEARGIHAILTSPEKLTIDTLNKYLELKARGLV